MPRYATVATYLVGLTLLAPRVASGQPDTAPTSATEAETETDRALLELVGVEDITIVDFHHDAASTYAPRQTLDRATLLRDIAASVPQTLERLAGFATAYNGPGAARPSLRGMQGDRVLLLDDGMRVGDLYWSAADHGVMLDPLGTQRVELLRGPSMLQYSAQSFGGVINLEQLDIPRTRPSLPKARVIVHGESAARAAAQGGEIELPLGPLNVRLDESLRHASDVRTARGVLGNTAIGAWSLGAGLSHLAARSEIGASVQHRAANYGVPGRFNGQLVPGGHPDGVQLRTARTRVHARAVKTQLAPGLLDEVALDATYTRYYHDELEGSIDNQLVVGAAFRQHMFEGRLTATHHYAAGKTQAKGLVGTSVRSTDLLAVGAMPGMRSNRDTEFAAFAYEAWKRGRLTLEASVRLEHRRLTPDDTRSIIVRTQATTVAHPVSARRFQLASGGLNLSVEATPGDTLYLSYLTTTRAPTAQELYADGPHLAAFSFDIGNPALAAERAHTAEVGWLAHHRSLAASATLYASFVEDYIYYLPTVDTVRVFREGIRPRITPLYAAEAADARLLGGEAQLGWQIAPRFRWDASTSYTHASERQTGTPLPPIPPLRAKTQLVATLGTFELTVGATLAAAQQRVVPSQIVAGLTVTPEAPTRGYALVDGALHWHRHTATHLHDVRFSVSNALDRAWYDHLSRIRTVAPGPGRNVQFVYAVTF